MLEDLIISKVRVKIIQLFLSNPGKIFHVREMVRRTKEEINAVRRELAHLEKSGVVSSEWRANRRYYEFRKDYIFASEIMNLVVKTVGLGGEIIKNRNKIGKIKYAMFSGNFIRGKSAGAEDVDVLLVGNIVLPQLSVLVKDEEARREREINYTVMTEEEYGFRVRRHDPFILGILQKSRVMILGDEEEMLKML